MITIFRIPPSVDHAMEVRGVDRIERVALRPDELAQHLAVIRRRHPRHPPRALARVDDGHVEDGHVDLYC
jgi:hypothetical protein